MIEEIKEPPINSILVLIAVLWTILVVLLAGINYRQSMASALTAAQAGARQAFLRDLVYRGWVASQGGVYVPVSAENPPNPYLINMPERDITTPSGKKLTLVNPAYMTRQVHELGFRQFGLRGHVTSLKPLRPENAPDEWEKKALLAFESGIKEQMSFDRMANETYLRFMCPLIVDQSCMACHAQQGYAVGDVRGGISVSIPWKPSEQSLLAALSGALIVFGSIWLTGLTGLAIGRYKFLGYFAERRRAETALRESEYSLKESQVIAGLGSYVLNIGEGLWKSSDVLDNIFGITKDYRHSVEGWVALIHPDDQAMMDSYLKNEILGRRRIFDKEYRIVRHDNQAERWVRGLGKLEFDAQGSPVIMRGTIQDITERKQAETEKAKLEARLHHTQKMESVGRLAGGVAHDFNNMLQAILGNAALILDESPADSSLRESVEEIQKSAQRAAELTRHLLAFARKQAIQPRVLDLNESIASVLKMLRRVIGDEIQLDWMPGTNLWPIKMDPSQIDEILANLCFNARDAMGEKGKVVIETANATLDEACAQSHLECAPGDYVTLVVSDTGQGMDAQTRAHLFEPFFTTKDQGKGVGLGLAIVFGIVKQNQGFIYVDSETGRGTTFRIFLPRAQVETLAAPTSVARSARGSETILLVEDEDQILHLAQRILAQKGYVILTASTPKEALAIIERHAGTIHLLISDVVMPGMNGNELYDRLRARNPQLKCLFMSGYTADVVAQHGVRNTEVEFLQKPFTLQKMAAKVQEVLDQPLKL